MKNKTIKLLLCSFVLSILFSGCGTEDSSSASSSAPSKQETTISSDETTEEAEKLGYDAIKNDKERELIEEAMNKPVPAKSTTTKNKAKKEETEVAEVAETEEKTVDTKKEDKKATETKTETTVANNNNNNTSTVASNNTNTNEPAKSEPAAQPTQPSSGEHVHTWVKTQIGTTTVTDMNNVLYYEHVQVHGDEYKPIFDDMGRVVGQELVSPAEYVDQPIYGSKDEPIYANVCSSCGATQ